MIDGTGKSRHLAICVSISFVAFLSLCPFVRQATRKQAVLVEGTQSLKAMSWRAVSLKVPYGGNLDVSVRVIRGDSLDVAEPSIWVL
jgi:hypothetical protein